MTQKYKLRHFRDVLLHHFKSTLERAKKADRNHYSDSRCRSLTALLEWLLDSREGNLRFCRFHSQFRTQSAAILEPEFSELCANLAFFFSYPLTPGIELYKSVELAFRKNYSDSLSFELPRPSNDQLDFLKLHQIAFTSYRAALDPGFLSVDWLSSEIVSSHDYHGVFLVGKDGQGSKLSQDYSSILAADMAKPERLTAQIEGGYQDARSVLLLRTCISSRCGSELYRAFYECRWRHLMEYTAQTLKTMGQAEKFRKVFQENLLKGSVWITEFEHSTDDKISKRLGCVCDDADILSDMKSASLMSDNLENFIDFIYRRKLICSVFCWDISSFQAGQKPDFYKGYSKFAWNAEGESEKVFEALTEKNKPYYKRDSSSYFLGVDLMGKDIVLLVELPFVRESLIDNASDLEAAIMQSISSINTYIKYGSSIPNLPKDRYIDLDKVKDFKELEAKAIWYFVEEKKWKLDKLGAWLGGLKRIQAGRRKKAAFELLDPKGRSV